MIGDDNSDRIDMLQRYHKAGNRLTWADIEFLFGEIDRRPATERARIVAWLREMKTWEGKKATLVEIFARSIERGDHASSDAEVLG
jgi:hypothetical protein